MKNRDHQYTDRTPAVFLLPADLRGPAFPTKDGGTIDRWNITQLIKAIELCGDAAGHTLSNIWLRHDKDAAEAWREAHWIFD